jgi:hypothetical protein
MQILVVLALAVVAVGQTDDITVLTVRRKNV